MKTALWSVVLIVLQIRKQKTPSVNFLFFNVFFSLEKKKSCSEIKFYQRHRQRIINDIFLKYWVDVGVLGGENPTRHTHTRQ